jgi:hypothetical protein
MAPVAAKEVSSAQAPPMAKSRLERKRESVVIARSGRGVSGVSPPRRHASPASTLMCNLVEEIPQMMRCVN